MELATFALALTGFILLALAMKRHREQMFGKGRDLPLSRLARPAGFALLGLSLLPCLSAYGLSMAVTWWLGLLTAAAAPVLLLLTYRPAVLGPLGAVAPVVALALLLAP
ncbi:hypothetical protein B2G71_04990 [Novosphingobium sp. PC22D]|uniref:DUF3325 domain-containing protein n=1 Tax=Novosphingobium sp. PC22D TaxID=1962403 RepID=UPI000BEFD376|nr:DUF3325 domain-containing protein [Novosphingobium sp. PC22D]PEQ13680.1 hypothetical protein B2G71_04990 [Novosphingobium sp. PC22D]